VTNVSDLGCLGSNSTLQSERIRHSVLGDGLRILTRPIRPDDDPQICQLLKRVSTEDLRLRFFDTIKDFSHQFIAKFTRLDHVRATATVAVDKNTNEIIGIVELHPDSTCESAELAILLRSDVKGRGLGRTLMQQLVEHARSIGVRRLFGQVLRENKIMLSLCRALGFKVTIDIAEPDLCCVSLELDA
jgi:acetyltransferase